MVSITHVSRNLNDHGDIQAFLRTQIITENATILTIVLVWRAHQARHGKPKWQISHQVCNA